jgi:hypothetical protein
MLQERRFPQRLDTASRACSLTLFLSCLQCRTLSESFLSCLLFIPTRRAGQPRLTDFGSLRVVHSCNLCRAQTRHILLFDGDTNVDSLTDLILDGEVRFLPTLKAALLSLVLRFYPRYCLYAPCLLRCSLLIKCLIPRLLSCLCIVIVNACALDTAPISLCAAFIPSVSCARRKVTRKGTSHLVTAVIVAFDCLNQEHPVQVLQTAGRGDLCST